MRRTPSVGRSRRSSCLWLPPLVAVLGSWLSASPTLCWAGGQGTLGSSDQAVREGSLVPSAPSSLGPAPTTLAPPAIPPATSVTVKPEARNLLTTPAVLALPPPRLVYQRRYNLVIVGTGLLLATWGADRLLARDLPDSSLTWLPWIPIVGPWYLLSTQQQLAAPSPATSALLVVDGLLQAGGLTIGILGFVLHKQRYVMALPPPAPASTPSPDPIRSP